MRLRFHFLVILVSASLITACSPSDFVPPVPQDANQAYAEADIAFTALVESADAAIQTGLVPPSIQFNISQAVTYAQASMRVARAAVDANLPSALAAISDAQAAIAKAKSLVPIKS